MQQVYYIYTSSFRKDRLGVDWLSVVKTKSRNHVQDVQDGNDEVTMGNDIFQLDELVNAYRVTLYTDLEKNSNFNVNENTYNDADVDIDELNDVLRTNRHM